MNEQEAVLRQRIYLRRLSYTFDKVIDQSLNYIEPTLKKTGAARNSKRYFGRKKCFVHSTEPKKVSNSFQYSEPFQVRYGPLEKVRKSV